jgi:hypothetical protein
LQLAVQPSLEHLAGLSDYFRRKVEISKDDARLQRGDHDHG